MQSGLECYKLNMKEANRIGDSERGNYENELRIKEICAWTEDESMQQLHQILSPSILNITHRDRRKDRGASLGC